MTSLRRLFCDFNGAVDEDAYALYCRGTTEDLSSLGVPLERGMRFTFYDGDGDEDGNPVDLLVDGEVDDVEPWGWIARVDPTTWRTVPCRVEEGHARACEVLSRFAAEFGPSLTHVADRVTADHPELTVRVSSSSVGGSTSFQGHALYLECAFPSRSDDQPDVLALEISLTHLTTQPRVFADVAWGHPSGHVEASIDDAVLSSEDWPLVAAGGMDLVRSKLGDLLDAFESAVRAGRPSGPPGSSQE